MIPETLSRVRSRLVDSEAWDAVAAFDSMAEVELAVLASAEDDEPIVLAVVPTDPTERRVPVRQVLAVVTRKLRQAGADDALRALRALSGPERLLLAVAELDDPETGQRAAMRRYRATEGGRAADRRASAGYYDRNGETVREKARARHAENRDRANAARRARYAANADRERENARARRASA